MSLHSIIWCDNACHGRNRDRVKTPTKENGVNSKQNDWTAALLCWGWIYDHNPPPSLPWPTIPEDTLLCPRSQWQNEPPLAVQTDKMLACFKQILKTYCTVPLLWAWNRKQHGCTVLPGSKLGAIFTPWPTCVSMRICFSGDHKVLMWVTLDKDVHLKL